MSKKIHVTDTILRDAPQSLIATRMRLEDMLPICNKLDKVGYWSLEVWGGATFDACVRFLKEDPWERLRKLRKGLPNTRLQMLLRGQNLLGYRHYSDDVVESFIAKVAENGIDVFRIFDAMNDVRNLETAIRAVKKSGKHAQGTLCYTTSPMHTIQTFVEQALTMRDLGVDSIVIKDMAGLLIPYVTGDLVCALKAETDLPIFIHSHDTSGVASMCQLKAIENGARHIDTAISSFAWGTSHPGTESMVVALRGTKYDTGLDLEMIQEISLYFYTIRQKYQNFESKFTAVDTRVQVNQVPGGMMSNLANQLKEQGALNRIDEVFAEIPRVREDLGFPPLVTPTSQIIGTQAVFNILDGVRYKTITNEVRYYLQGRYGKAPGNINKNLQLQAIGGGEIIDVRPADLIPPELEKLRAEIGSLAKSEEDVLTYAMFPDIGRQFLQEREEKTLVPEALLSGQSESVIGQGVATEFIIDVHGESYQVDITGVGVNSKGKRNFYISIDGVPEEVVVEPINNNSISDKRKTANALGDVSISMPGNIIDVLIQIGDKVKAGQPILITETMKMESEIQAPIAGTVKAVHVAKGDRVIPGKILVTIEA